jgi:hypothetical protein
VSLTRSLRRGGASVPVGEVLLELVLRNGANCRSDAFGASGLQPMMGGLASTGEAAQDPTPTLRLVGFPLARCRAGEGVRPDLLCLRVTLRSIRGFG